jgi:hypothetical protein
MRLRPRRDVGNAPRQKRPKRQKVAELRAAYGLRGAGGDRACRYRRGQERGALPPRRTFRGKGRRVRDVCHPGPPRGVLRGLEAARTRRAEGTQPVHPRARPEGVQGLQRLREAANRNRGHGVSARPQRIVLDFRHGELVVRCLYSTQDGPGPSTKARRREVSALVRGGVEQAQERRASR